MTQKERYSISDDVAAVSTAGAASTVVLATFSNVRLGRILWIRCTAGAGYLNVGAAASSTAKVAYLAANEEIWIDWLDISNHATLAITMIRDGATNMTVEGTLWGVP